MAYELRTFDTREEWLENRGIGGSDVAAILGVDPWGSPLKVWAEKTGRAELQPPSQLRLDVGHALEPLILGQASLALPGDLSIWAPIHAIARDPEEPEYTYSPDGFVVTEKKDLLSLVEAKNTISRTMWEDPAEPAPHVFVQVQWGMDILELGTTDIWVLKNQAEMLHYVVEFNPTFAAAAKELVGRFYREHIEKDIPPEADAHDATKKVLAELLPLTRSQTVELDPDVWGPMLARLEEVGAQMKMLMSEKNKLTNELKLAALREAGIAGEALPDEQSIIDILVPEHGRFTWKKVHVDEYTVKPFWRDDWRKKKL